MALTRPEPGAALGARKRIRAGLAALPVVGSVAAGLFDLLSPRSYEGRRDTILGLALEMPREERRAFIDRKCKHDPALHEDVLSLLEANDAAGDFFDDLSATVVAPALSAILAHSSPPSWTDVRARLETKVAGEYRIESELGGGGMSRVFVAEDLRLKRRVVIKVLPPEVAPGTSEERFHREIELAAKLQHPHIVPVLATDSADGILYYTMPFVTGESLSVRIAREGALPLDVALKIWRDVLDALAHAHANGVVHFDIKPGNILLSGRNAVVTDFGISRAVETSADEPNDPASGPLMGTPAYAAPEVAIARPAADHRADLYGAGLVMYEMLAGKQPFVADSAGAYLVAHRDLEPTPLDRPDIPHSLVSLVMRCLAKDPADRPKNADSVLADLVDLAGGGDSHATHNSASHRAWRLTSYSAAALALVTVAVISVRLLRDAADSTPGQVPDVTGVAVSGRTEPSIAAYEWYVRGMDVALLRTDEGRRLGAEYFRRAVEIDSTYVAAYAGLVRMNLQLSNSAPSAEKLKWFNLAEQAALAAVALDSTSADGRAALGWVRLLGRDYPAAEAEFRRAIEIDPAVPRVHEGLSRVFMMTGRPIQQLSEARIGLQADPFSHSAIRELGLALAANDRCEESLEQLAALKKLTPPAGVAGVVGGLCYASRQMWPEAIAEFRWARDNSATAGPAFLGYALARAGRTVEARTILSDLIDGRTFSHGAFGIGIVYAGLNEYDDAFLWLDRAVDDRTMHFYIAHPAFREIHLDSRFVRLRDRMGMRKP